MTGVPVPVKRRSGDFSRCQAVCKSGKPCTAPAKKGSRFCALHGNPQYAAEIGRKGGQSNRHVYETHDFPVPSTAAEVKDMLAEVTSGILAGRLNPKIGTVVGYLSIPLLKAIEASDFEDRLRKLEGGNGDEIDQSRKGATDGKVTKTAP